MGLLRQEITNRGVQGGIPNPPDDATKIENLDPIVLLEIQAAFGHLIATNANLVALVNNLGPVLFATLLFTAMEEYRITDDGEGVEPTKDVFEAEAAAIGMVRSVAAAMGSLTGDVTIEPTDREVNGDTEVVGVGAA